ncbi:leucine--tRNA ligase [Candidatus Marsarchaeota archaeon]|nr:leucine--tRNA ligase [Candidatus Marsarchaeota archaeon]
MDYKEIDSRWQKKWADARIFESDVGSKDPYLVTVAFPYVNAPLHIGHIRTYGTADVLARYKRMRGYNVLFPMGFHATGTPILAFAKRLRNNDKELVAELKLFHISDQTIAQMTDPLFIANYFVKDIEYGMHRAGLSIDWRRKFVSTDPQFSKFIEWQFGILNSKEYLVKGRHPVGWCPNENNAVGMHDTKHDVEPDIEGVLSIRFKVEGEDAYLLCTTYRPETLFGVTNIFVNKDIKYTLCRINGGHEPYYVSKEASKSLAFQFKIEPISDIPGSELLSKRGVNPINGESVPVFPGFFVKGDVGTGVVMSVPAHAPFDYAALKRLRESGYPMPDIKPRRVMEIKAGGSINPEGYVDLPAMAYIGLFAKGSDAGDDLLEKATKLQYREEAHLGKMVIHEYEGMGGDEAGNKVKGELMGAGNAFEIYILANSPVYCRCGYPVAVKVVDDQWFINYGNKEWKSLAAAALKGITILPEKSKRAFDAALDWIGLRAVARSQGLGTRFPLDKGKIIESLSDSTIYMSFYTISNLIRDLPAEKLIPELFDYVYLNKGDPQSVSSATGIDFQLIKRCRESFDYWYRNTSRHSAGELIFNHLTMYIFNHAAIFAKEYWPRQIAVNGMVLSEGEKMSKSLGNIVPLVDGIEKYGTDVIRMQVIASADLFSDSDFSEVAVRGIDERFRYLFDLVGRIDEFDSGELRHIDYWLYSKLNRKVASATEQIEKLELRGVSTSVFYDSILELRKYLARGSPNGIVLKDYLSCIILMLAPIAPHVAEEIWHGLGNESFVSLEKWPQADGSMISDKVEAEEDMLDSIIADTNQVAALIRKSGKEPRSVRIIVADEWKRSANNIVAKDHSIKQIMERLNSAEGMQGLGLKPEDRERSMKYVQNMAKKMNQLRQLDQSQDDEYGLLAGSVDYLKKSLGYPVTVEPESKSDSKRAHNAAPQRPSIDISS